MVCRYRYKWKTLGSQRCTLHTTSTWILQILTSRGPLRWRPSSRRRVNAGLHRAGRLVVLGFYSESLDTIVLWGFCRSDWNLNQKCGSRMPSYRGWCAPSREKWARVPSDGLFIVWTLWDEIKDVFVVNLYLLFLVKKTLGGFPDFFFTFFKCLWKKAKKPLEVFQTFLDYFKMPEKSTKNLVKVFQRFLKTSE